VSSDRCRIDARRHSTQHFVFGSKMWRAAEFDAWPFDPPAPHPQGLPECKKALSFNQHFGKVANITVHQGSDFPAQYDSFAASVERLLTVRRRSASAGVSGVAAASTGFLSKIDRDVAPRGQQAAMRGLRLSLSRSVTDKVS
jgi:hypothetical protein